MKAKPKCCAFRILSFLVFGTINVLPVQAQSAIAGSGGNASGIGGKVSFTAGQVFYITAYGTTGNVAQGVQQPFEISVPTGAVFPEITLDWNIYPNPVAEILTLKIGRENPELLSYQLFDINGQLLKNDKIRSAETSIYFSGYKPGTYFLKVALDNREIKTFKIIKN